MKYVCLLWISVSTSLEIRVIQLRIKGNFKKGMSKEMYVLITSFVEQGY